MKQLSCILHKDSGTNSEDLECSSFISRSLLALSTLSLSGDKGDPGTSREPTFLYLGEIPATRLKGGVKYTSFC